jgi:hypothetical protein
MKQPRLPPAIDLASCASVREAVIFQASFPTPDRTARPKASDIDGVLHAERLDERRKRLHDLTSPSAALPDGAMIFQDSAPHLILKGVARRWSLAGYDVPTAPLDGARLIPPPSTVAVLRAGYQPRLHAAAFGNSDPDSRLVGYSAWTSQGNHAGR